MTLRGDPGTSSLRNMTGTGDIPLSPGDDRAGRRIWTDEALMAAVVIRDPLAFAAIYDRYAALVYSASLRVLSDVHEAEDVTQDVFVRLWRRPETFIAGRGRFLSWLMSVARNRAVDELRSRGRRHRREIVNGDSLEDDPSALVPAETDDPLLTAQLHEAQKLVRAALVGLPAEQRRALELAYFGGFTQQEISLVLHEPLGTVKTRIRLGMQKLRRALENRV